MISVADEIKREIKKALEELQLPSVEISLEHPEREEHGDYSSNIALTMFSKLKAPKSKLQTSTKSQLSKYKNPRELAEAIVKKLRSYNLPAGKAGLQAITKVEVAGPGFINFWLSEHFLLGEAERVLSLGKRYGTNIRRKGKKVIVEFTDPNPFKEFHIGHLYSNVVGESLARLLEASGATVKRANYQGDVGLHVAKALYGLSQISNSPSTALRAGKFQISKWEKRSLEDRAKLLGEAYATGARAYEEDKAAKNEIEALNQKVYAQDPDIRELYEKGRQWSLEYFETIYKRLGTKFDFYYFEREAGEVGLEVVMEHLKNGVFVESQGAVVFPGEKYGLHTRVFVNSQGLPTYEAKDLGLAPTKYKDFAYDESIIVTGNEVDEYFRVVLKALSLINPDLGSKTRHISHGMVRLPGGKMSSRTGTVLTGEWLLDEAKRRVLRIVQEQSSNQAIEQASNRDQQKILDLDEVAEIVGLGAVKYALLRSNIGRDIAFDFEESVSFEGNSGPYLQYTYARARSVLQKARKATFKGYSFKGRGVVNEEEMAVLRWLYRYPEVVLQAGDEYSPNLVCGFLYELAQRFNSFYNKHRIIQAENEEQKRVRLGLTAATARVIENGLRLLGIKAPRKM